MNLSYQWPKCLALLLISFLSFACSDTFTDSPYPPIEFVGKKVMPGTGRSSAVAFVIHDKGYVALGRDATNTALSDCWEFDPVLENWTLKAPFPGSARVKAMAAVVNNRAYIGLGYFVSSGVYNEESYPKDFWMFEPLTNSWIRKADFPSKASNACVSFIYNNYIYVGGGFAEFGFTNEFWKYDTEKDLWIHLNDFPGHARSGSVICSNGEHIFFGTGYRTLNENDWWEYFPKSDSWKKRKSMPDDGRENAVSLCINNRIFVSTGRHFAGNMTGGHVKSDIIEYNVDRNLWYKRGNIKDGIRENAISFTIKGKGYIGFGENDTEVLNDFWCFEP